MTIWTLLTFACAAGAAFAAYKSVQLNRYARHVFETWRKCVELLAEQDRHLTELEAELTIVRGDLELARPELEERLRAQAQQERDAADSLRRHKAELLARINGDWQRRAMKGGL